MSFRPGQKRRRELDVLALPFSGTRQQQLPCAWSCVPVCKECRNNPHLWEPLIAAELLVPVCVLRRDRGSNEFNEDDEDVFSPLCVRDQDRRLVMRVSVHQRLGGNGYDANPTSGIFVGYAVCNVAGMLVQIHCTLYRDGEAVKSYGSSHITSTRDKMSDSYGLYDIAGPGHLLTVKNAECEDAMCDAVVINLEVLQRRLPTALPPAIQADRQSGSSSLCDVTLSADGRDFPAHRVVLAASSDVFKAMFTGDFKEKSADRVEIKETSAKVLASFLDFLYADGCPVWEDCDEVELLALADRYQVHRLKQLCLSRLWSLPGASALAVLARSSRSPLLLPDLRDRLCRQAALLLGSLRDSDEWWTLMERDSFTAGVVEGMAKSVGREWSAIHLFEPPKIDGSSYDGGDKTP